MRPAYRSDVSCKRLGSSFCLHHARTETGAAGAANSGYGDVVPDYRRREDNLLLIKSAGEWISSIDLENAIMGFSKVLEAAVISLPDEKWQERPLACVVPQPDVVKTITKEEIQDYLKDKVAKWWIPDEIVFMQELPKTSVGKVNKKKLRETVIPDILKKRGKA